MSEPEISVVMSMKDAGNTVERAVQSVLRQTLASLEFVIVDDCSSDDSLRIVRRLAGEDPRLRVLENAPPGGLSKAHELACAATRTPWLARMDADDEAHPEWLERQLFFLRAHPDVDVCGCLSRAGSPLGEGIKRYVDWTNRLVTHQEIAAARFVESPVIHPGSVVRKEALVAAGGYRDLDWAEDYDLWLRLLETGSRFARNPETLMTWNDSPSRLTRADPRYSQNAFLRCKAHHLAQMGLVRELGVALCGAGPIGKRAGRFLQSEGVEIRAYFEVSERKIGETINGAPVLSHDAFPGSLGPGEVVLLGTVGTPGARERIQGIARDAGFEEGRDFFCLA